MTDSQYFQPGPWHERAGQIYDAHGSLIAVVMAHDTPVGAANARLIIAASRATVPAPEGQDAPTVSVPEGLARSDAEFWLRHRGAIIDALRAEGLSIVSTAHGVHLMRLGKIEAKTAAQSPAEGECPPASCNGMPAFEGPLSAAQAQRQPKGMPAGFTEAHASYVARWGGNCRDCADENGVCPNSGLPCGGADKAIAHVFKALEYGVKHAYISNPLSTDTSGAKSGHSGVRSGHKAETAQAPAPAHAKIIKLGSYGQAFDAPGDRRAYTYKHQPGNQAAWRIGDASSRVEAGGDLIDRGLSLLKVLEAGGFGVFELDESAAVEAPAVGETAPAACNCPNIGYCDGSCAYPPTPVQPGERKRFEAEFAHLKKYPDISAETWNYMWLAWEARAAASHPPVQGSGQ